MKILLITIGCLSVALGVIGIFLPLLPTTPFLLLASACFLRSSPRLHKRLLASPVLGSYIQAYMDGRGIPLRAKILAFLLLWASLLYSCSLFPELYVRLALLTIGLATSILLLRIKTLRA
jgi:uncharacterized membrane protein YbaN (DUF454 family)